MNHTREHSSFSMNITIRSNQSLNSRFHLFTLKSEILTIRLFANKKETFETDPYTIIYFIYFE